VNRRAFLQRLASGLVVVGAAVDLERLLWVPGAKRYFIPDTHPMLMPACGHAICAPPFVPGDGTMFNPTCNIAGMYLKGTVPAFGFDWEAPPASSEMMQRAMRALQDQIERDITKAIMIGGTLPDHAGLPLPRRWLPQDGCL
jgi:hypothetical protein